MNTDSREVEWEATRRQDTTFDGLDELRYIGVAGVEGRICVDDADDG